MLIVDLDDTLVASTKLNNDAYNYALEKFGFAEINSNNRITREDLKSIRHDILQKIIAEKQNYFIKEWLAFRLTINRRLLLKMQAVGKDNCFVWTRSSRSRALSMISGLKIDGFISGVIFDDKTDFTKSAKLLRTHTGADRVILYENERIKGLKIVDYIRDGNFNVNGYAAKLTDVI